MNLIYKMLRAINSFLQIRKNNAIIEVEIKVNLDLRVAEYGNKRENLTFNNNHQ